MFLEIHILQNFAPANLNRDDTGAPKDCEFGGVRRARISSQCLKRAVRTHVRNEELLPPEALSKRTKRLVEELTKRLATRGREPSAATSVARAALAGAGLAVKDGDKTEYLLFLGNNEIEAMVGVCDDFWDDLLRAVGDNSPTNAGEAGGGAKRSAKDAKDAGKNAVPAPVKKAVLGVLDGGKAADLALFGRMIADLPDKNVDAACQVAHAISTNKVSVEFDFYTAVDDLKPNDTAGADMLGTVEFNSACFYRYANLDIEQLRRNLGDDVELARRTIEVFLRASIAAVPTGKQNSMAAQNPPSFVFAVARERGLWSLANAFSKPIAPNREGGLLENSIGALDRHWGQLVRMYGTKGIVGIWACALGDDPLTNLAPAKVDGIDALVDGVLGAVTFGGRDGAGAR